MSWCFVAGWHGGSKEQGQRLHLDCCFFLSTVPYPSGSNYYVRILSTLNRELLKPSSSVALHRHSNALVDILPPEADSSISLLGDNEKPNVTYQVSKRAGLDAFGAVCCRQQFCKQSVRQACFYVCLVLTLFPLWSLSLRRTLVVMTSRSRRSVRQLSCPSLRVTCTGSWALTHHAACCCTDHQAQVHRQHSRSLGSNTICCLASSSSCI